MSILKRAWVNAPSTHSPAHHMHGLLGLAMHDGGHVARFFPVSGDVESIRISWSDISFGWPAHLRVNPLQPKIAAAKDVVHKIMGIDAVLNFKEECPTGDEYNDLIELVKQIHKELS